MVDFADARFRRVAEGDLPAETAQQTGDLMFEAVGAGKFALHLRGDTETRTLTPGLDEDEVKGVVIQDRFRSTIINVWDELTEAQQAVYFDDPNALRNEVTAAVRTAVDKAIAWLQGVTTGGADVVLIEGQMVVTDELVSDAAQESWWNQTNLEKKKFLRIRGAGSGLTEIQIASDYVGPMRNAARGNLRTFGPWASQPSPNILFPFITTRDQSFSPSAVWLEGFTIRGVDDETKDPLPILIANELDCFHDDVKVKNVAHAGHHIMGTFNSTYTRCHFEGSGLQPVDSGVVLGNNAGFPPPWCVFDIDGPGTQITAKAGATVAGYTQGDVVPFFQTYHVGLQFVVHQGALHSSLGQPAVVTITSVPSANSPTATIAYDSGINKPTVADRPGSFLPMRCTTTAGNSNILLSSPLKIGAGSIDMLGRIVSIPKAGSVVNPDWDVFTSRIIGVSNGNDTDGYSTITLAAAPRESVTDFFILGAAHSTAQDETLMQAGLFNGCNDTDFIQCRWELSSGFDEDVSAAAFMFISQGAYSVQYVACKAHGCNVLRGQFAADGQAIIDDAQALQLIGIDFTHMAYANGQVRRMGKLNHVSLSGVVAGSWQLPANFKVFYADPQTGYDPNDWSWSDPGLSVANDVFPDIEQEIYAGDPSLSAAEVMALFTANYNKGKRVTVLDALTEIDDLRIPGEYQIKALAEAPSDTPEGGQWSILIVRGSNNENNFAQELIDLDGHITYRREYFAGTWSAWRKDRARGYTTVQLSDQNSFANRIAKDFGVIELDTTTNKGVIAMGPAQTDPWQPLDGSAQIVPS